MGLERVLWVNNCQSCAVGNLEVRAEQGFGVEGCRRSTSIKISGAGSAGELSRHGVGGGWDAVRKFAGWNGLRSSKGYLGLSSFSHSSKDFATSIQFNERRDRRTSLSRCGSLNESSKEGKAESPAAAFRRLLATPGLHLGPASHDALSAKLVEQAGFSFTFMSGFAVSAVRLALPDTGLISYGEIVDQGRQITSAVSIPVIGDGDNGYGNALNVKRTVKGYIQAGFAGILLEDQVSPKACGHTQGRRVVSREEAITRIRAASDACKEALSEFVIIARTDAHQAISLEEALWRVEAFAEAGADVLFVDALSSKEDMIAFCKVCHKVPKMANMLEGGGRTPLLTPLELENIGFKIVAYPLSLLGVSIRAMQDALLALKSGRFPRPGSLPSFDEIKDVVGFNSYYKEEERYSLVYPTIIPPAEATDPAQSQEDISSLNMTEERVTDRTLNSIAEQTVGQWGVKSGSEDSTVASDQEQPSKETEATYIIPNVIENADGSNRRSSQPGIWSRVLRVKITGSGGLVKLDVRIPAGFLDGLTRTVPGIAGFNIGSLVNEAASNMDSNFESGQQLVDIMDRGGDRFQVFLE